MPSIHNISERHVEIDRRSGHYLCFPDVCVAEEERLIVAYNEYDRHVGSRRRLLAKVSDDAGQTWAPSVFVNARGGHCPRMARIAGGRVMILDDSGVYFGSEGTETFAFQGAKGFPHGIPDRPLQLDFETLLTAGHMFRGTQNLPVSGQPLVEQMVYRSENQGASWTPLSVMTHDENLPLCEVSMARMPDGDIFALQRENSYVYEPMYACMSSDEGQTWSRPVPTPLAGHRPCMGLSAEGRLVVTYRDVGPDPGTKAWTGTVDELLGTDYQVHGLHAESNRLRFTDNGLEVKCPKSALPVRWALRPMTDPRRARAEFSVRVRVDRVGGSGIGMRLGCWFKLYPDRVEACPDSKDGSEKPKKADLKRASFKKGVFHTFKLVYENGCTELFVNGRKKFEVDVDPEDRWTRPILFGSKDPKKKHAAKYVVRTMSLRIDEPGYERHYKWAWKHTQGMPDKYIQDRVLELRNNRFASLGDFGYSGWVELPDGRIFCVYHDCDPNDESYDPGRTCHVAGTWFELGDFG